MLSLNVKKSNFLYFRPNNIREDQMDIEIMGTKIEQKQLVK